MIRLFALPGCGGYKNILLRLDGSPPRVLVADSNYLADFFAGNSVPESTSQDDIMYHHMMLLSQYWLERIEKPEKGKTFFLPFDLSDECVLGLNFTRNRKGFQVSIAWTPHLRGWSIKAETLEAQLSSLPADLQEEGSWFLPEEDVKEGLENSMARFVRELHLK